MKSYVLLSPEGQADKQLLQNFNDPIPCDALKDKKIKDLVHANTFTEQNDFIISQSNSSIYK